jgi:DNA-binding NtrC family response regulator
MERGRNLSHERSLDGLRVLVIEDEFYIADDLRRVLCAAGAMVVGPVSTVEKAQEALSHGGFDCVVLDLNLHGESGVPVADGLLEMGTPFAIVTGYGSASVPDRLKSVPRCEKPVESETLTELVSRLCGDEVPAETTISASPPANGH